MFGAVFNMATDDPHVKTNANQKWKPVTFKPDGDFDGLASISILTQYEIIDGQIIPKSQDEKHVAVGKEIEGDSKIKQLKSKPKKKEKQAKNTSKQSKEPQKKSENLSSKSTGKVVSNTSEKDDSSKVVVNEKPENRKQRKARLYKEKMLANKKQKKERIAALRKTQKSKDKVKTDDKSTCEPTTKPLKRKASDSKKGKIKKMKSTVVDDDDSDSGEEGSSNENSQIEDRNLDQEKIKEEMKAWKDLLVPEPVLRALHEKGFSTPTPIQALTLPSAIRDRKDIIGAAETGSGKTLSFGIPLLYRIMSMKIRENSQSSTNEDVKSSPDESLSSGDEEDVNELEDESKESVDNEDDGDDDEKDEEKLDEDDIENDDDLESNLSFSGEDEWDDDELNMPVEKIFDSLIDSPAEVVEDSSEMKPVAVDKNQRLYCLVLTPTRELAMQVKNHLESAAKYTGIKVAVILGGMAPQKQLRVLKGRPEIVVATPGRLWELIQEEEPHLSQGAKNLPFLVIDEADRMVEKGHFEELSKLLEMINEDENIRLKRQNFIFSATLTYVHKAPIWLMYKKRKKSHKPMDLTTNDKLDSLIMKIGIREKPKIVDLTRKTGTAETLIEAKINCRVQDKDIYLYYFLHLYPGRTLVFVNSKDCLRRLVSILTLLRCNPLPLHADMHQTQRLKNLDRFTANPKALLLATDVAARGLDIPDVQHVIHYQVPKTTENYVHRSGRTARATKEGLSVMLVSPPDMRDYRKIIKSLNKDEELPTFPVQEEYLPGVRERVALTVQIEKTEHSISKKKHENDWFLNAAKEADLDLDEELIHDFGDEVERSDTRNKQKRLKMELDNLLRQRISLHGYSGKYPTKSGKLQSIYMAKDKSNDALKTVKEEKDVLKKLQTKSSKNTKRKRRKKKNVTNNVSKSE